MLSAKEIFFDEFRLAEIRKKKKLLDFAGFWQDLAEITVEGILGKKN
jgi:hypothetical protein